MHSAASNGNAPRHSPRQLWRESIADYAIRDAMLQHAGCIRGRVLDLGCGDRRYEPYLRAHASQWVGIDWPAAGDTRAGCADIFGDALALPFADASFDTVLCTQVLEHVAEPETLFREAARVLKAGGHLVLTAPQYNALHEEPRDFFRYTRHGLEHLAAKTGFTPQAAQPIGGFVALFAFVTTIHFAPLRVQPLFGLWQRAAWALDRRFRRPKDCLGNILVARR